jgi:hypothetical protein
LFFAMPVCTRWTISGRIGLKKTAGIVCVLPVPFPSLPMMVTVGREAILVDRVLVDGNDSILGCKGQNQFRQYN